MGGGGTALPTPALAPRPPVSLSTGGGVGGKGGRMGDGTAGALAKAKSRSGKDPRDSSSFSAMDVDEAECSSGGSSPQTLSSEDLGNEGDIEDHGEGGTSADSDSGSSSGGGGRGGW